MKVTKLLSLALMVLCITLASCQKDGASTSSGGGSHPGNITNCDDPEGTITANLRNDEGFISMFNLHGGGIKLSINAANNFVGTPYDDDDRLSFVSAGEIDGLGCIMSVPQAGWSNQVAVIPGNGYILKFEEMHQDWIPEVNAYITYYITTYARIYVVRYILSANYEILGAEIKYQDYWKSLLSVTTAFVTNITATSATCGGKVTGDGGLEVTARGVCWSTSQNPTINDSHTTDGSGTGAFTSNITGLASSTTYYVRAYVTNINGVSYGENKSFKTLYDSPDGSFSINDHSSVFFSQGNLQYQASTNTWQFAEHQWDCIGNDNSNISSSYSGWIDLFGWGTGNDPTNSSTYNYDYDTFNDWGNNAIINGGSTSNAWRTLTSDEWVYVLNTRNTSSGIRYAKATVNRVNGVILLPDNWSSSNYSLSNTNNGNASFSSNGISQSDWTNRLEANGAVFLPAAGKRYGTDVYYDGSCGYYWSASYKGSNGAYYVYFYDDYLNADNGYSRVNGHSVRLVCSAE